MTYEANQQHPTPPGSISTTIAVADDPCEVVEEALPAMVIGDLTAADEHAIEEHCAACRDCAEIRGAWETSLAEPDLPVDAAPPSPARALGLHEGHYGLMESPLGDLLIAVTEDGIAEIGYLANHDREEELAELEARGILATERSATVEPVREQLREYFAHRRNEFTLPVDLYGITPFTRQVLEATSRVPFGRVRTYQGIAQEIGKPKASRAVGNALGRNPVPVVIPCHRVVRADGSMGWYTGGAHIKEKLLDIEGVAFPQKSRNHPVLPGLGGT
ncbi:MAG: methylated-DNA--[protein]-cysteine S-methyltransferase [Chloroflexota bacterium]|nr:methylated-DNA--[protein]-cysteine S-methyltransferase [Chloroflexota bacterium]